MTLQDFQKFLIKMFYFFTSIINQSIFIPWDLGKIIHKALRVVILITSRYNISRQWFRRLEIQYRNQIMIANGEQKKVEEFRGEERRGE